MVSREQLLERVWGYDYFGDTRLLDVHIRRLRRKVEDDPGDPRWSPRCAGSGTGWRCDAGPAGGRPQPAPAAYPGGQRLRPGIGGRHLGARGRDVEPDHRLHAPASGRPASSDRPGARPAGAAELRPGSDGLGELLTGLAASPEAAIFVRRGGGWITAAPRPTGSPPRTSRSAARRGRARRDRAPAAADRRDPGRRGSAAASGGGRGLRGGLPPAGAGPDLPVHQPDAARRRARQRRARRLPRGVGQPPGVAPADRPDLDRGPDGPRRPGRPDAGPRRPGSEADRRGLQRDRRQPAGAGRAGRPLRLGRQPRAALAGHHDDDRDGGAAAPSRRDVAECPARR